MQNKPNVKDAQINVNSYMKSIYEKLDTWLSGKNKPNSNPIQTQSNPILSAVGGLQMSVNSILTKDYERNDIFAVPENKPNSNPIQTQFKPCPELAEALSAAEGAVEWANLETTPGQACSTEFRAGFVLSDWMVELWSQSIVTGHKVIFGYFCLSSVFWAFRFIYRFPQAIF